MAFTGRYQQTYNSFSGVDMSVMIGTKLVAEIQGVSYTVTREKAPLYTMGSADPRSFSRGKRGIAGSMIFLVFDRSALLDTLQEEARYVANEYETVPGFQQIVSRIEDQAIIGFDQAITPDPTTVGSARALDPANQIDFGKVIASPRYHDQILPFNLVLVARNEYGHKAQMQICNMELMNCGSGMSIDDITTDESCTFVATSLIPWHLQGYIDPRTPGSLAYANQMSHRAARAGSV
jgi:hypothetical protein